MNKKCNKSKKIFISHMRKSVLLKDMAHQKDKAHQKELIHKNYNKINNFRKNQIIKMYKII